MKNAKVLTTQDFVHFGLKESGGFTLLVVHTNLAETAIRPDEREGEEARTFFAAVLEAAEEFPEIRIALLDSLAHPQPARLLSACMYEQVAQCEALAFIDSSFVDHRMVHYDDATKESLRSWLLGLLLLNGQRHACSRDEAMLLLAFYLAEPPEIDYVNEARWDDTPIRDRAIEAVTARMKALYREWHGALEDDELSDE